MGTPQLRKAIAHHFNEHYQLDVNWQTETIVGAGATELLAGTSYVLSKNFSPFWIHISFRASIDMCFDFLMLLGVWLVFVKCGVSSQAPVINYVECSGV